MADHKYWLLTKNEFLVFLGRFQLHLTLKLLHIYHKTKLCPLLNIIGGPLAQLDETRELWPGSNQLSLFNLFIVSHILHICSEYICVLYNRVCSFKHSPRSELCLGARAWTVLSLLACKLLCLRAMTVRLRNSGVIVVCGGDFSTFQQGILTLFWEERGVVCKYIKG